jgi:AcrR family transcriptional regulator
MNQKNADPKPVNVDANDGKGVGKNDSKDTASVAEIKSRARSKSAKPVKKEGRRKKTTQKRADEVRSRILSAALECFGAHGFEGASTRTIAELAGVTHTLVLYHFQSKDLLWVATVENVLSKYGKEIHENLNTNHEKTASSALKKFIDQFVRFSARYPQIHRIFTTEGNQDTERLKWVIDHFLRDHFSLVIDIIRRGQSEGTIRQCDPARLYYLIIGVGGTPFTISTEYKELTGRNVFSEAEILRNIAFIYEIVFG